MSSGFATGKELYGASRVRQKAFYVARANEEFHLSGNFTVGVRLQRMGFDAQALVLARIAQARFPEGQFTPRQIEELFVSFTLPKPAKISNVVAKLRKGGLLTQGNKNGTWRMTPLGRHISFVYLSDLDCS